MDAYDRLLFGQPDADEEPQYVHVEITELDDLDDDFDDDLDEQDYPRAPLNSPQSDDAASEASTIRGQSTMATGGASPSSSPRLPSPPPFTEVQIGPKYPTVSDSFGNVNEELPGNTGQDAEGSIRRIRPGTSAGDMAAGPPLVPLAQLDSPFQLQEHLKALYQNYTSPENSNTVLPITRETALELAEPPEGVERSLWLYELCRFLTMKANNIIVAFFSEDPPCSSQTCPEMRASEWQYLCAVHDPPKSCCAIDYCCHTLDWATNILTSPKYFPSRLTLGSEAGGGPQASMKHLTNIFRRLYRIFAHAWFQHREVFWQVEGHNGLYVFFKTVCDVYNLIPEDNYTIPAEAEGVDSDDAAAKDEQADARKVTVLQRESDSGASDKSDAGPSAAINTGATARRHRHTPSTGASVATISEGVEEVAEEGPVDDESKKLPNLDEDTVLELPKVTEQDVENGKVEPDTQEVPIRNEVPIEAMPEEKDNSKDEVSTADPEQEGNITTQLSMDEPEPESADKEEEEAEPSEKDAPIVAVDDGEKADEAPETPSDPNPETTEGEASPETEAPPETEGPPETETPAEASAPSVSEAEPTGTDSSPKEP